MPVSVLFRIGFIAASSTSEPIGPRSPAAVGSSIQHSFKTYSATEAFDESYRDPYRR